MACAPVTGTEVRLTTDIVELLFLIHRLTRREKPETPETTAGQGLEPLKHGGMRYCTLTEISALSPCRTGGTANDLFV